MRRSMIVLSILMTLLVLASCAEKKEPEATKVVQPSPPGSIRASHILISFQGASRTTATRTKEEAKVLADDLLGKIKAGESFEELAEVHSDCPTAAKQGDLGFFKKGRMVKEFEDAAFALEPGGVSGVIETQFGYHIIKRTQ